MIRLFELLSAEECERASRLVHELRPHWLERPLELRYAGRDYHEKSYTLGITAYVEGRDDPGGYRRRARESNALLREHFGWIYDRLPGVLERATGRAAFYDDDLALPGFHIFLASKVFELPLAPVHFDVQYQHLDWSDKDVSFERTVSFTAAVVLPRGGGGMNMWDLSSHEVEGRPLTESAGLLRRRVKTHVPYTVGKMVVHSGEQLHQIAPMKDVCPKDERITLQGHGVVSKGAHLLYW